MIQLLSPLALLLLTLSGVVLIYHFLRPRHKEQRAPSLMLWVQVHQALSSHVRWRRLVNSLLLIVHLLIVALLAFAWSHPVLLDSEPRAVHLVVIDHSASMLARDVEPDRFARAQREAAAWVQQARGEFVVVAAGSPPYVAYRGQDPRKAAAVIDGMEPVAGTTDWHAVAHIMAALDPEPTTVHIWTDGVTDEQAFASLSSAAAGRVTTHLVGTEHPQNVGITAFEARPLGEVLHRYEALLRLVNFGTTPTQVPIRIMQDETELYAQSLPLAPGEEHTLLFELDIRGESVVTARIEVEDALGLDNEAYIVASPPQRTRVAIVGVDSRHLEEGLSIFPQTEFERRLFVGAAEPYHLAVFNRVAGTSVAGASLEIVPPTDDTEEEPVILWWDATHPLTRYIEWRSITLRKGTPLPVDAATRVLVDSNVGPLLTVDETGEYPTIRLGFALEESDFPLRVAFPIFLSNLLEYVHPAGWHSLQQPVPPGVAFSLPDWLSLSAEPDAIQVIGSDGSRLAVEGDERPYGVTPRLSGLHTVQTPTGTAHFVVALPAREEASLTRSIPVQAESPLEASPVPVARPLWPYALIVIIVLLFIEAWLFSRKGLRPRRRREDSAPIAPEIGTRGWHR